jgi:hypothetical protein
VAFGLHGTDAVRLAQEDEGSETEEAPVMTMETFQQGFTGMDGQAVRLEGVNVATMIGPQAFLTALPDGAPFVIRMMPGAAQGPVAGSDVLDLTGTVRTMSDAVLDAWEAQGVIDDPTAREIAGFGSHFLEATRIRPAASSAEQDTVGDDGDER